jgi:hypothetical protein
MDLSTKETNKMTTFTNILTKETYKALRSETRVLESIFGGSEEVNGVVFEVLETGEEKFLSTNHIYRVVEAS